MDGVLGVLKGLNNKVLESKVLILIVMDGVLGDVKWIIVSGGNSS